MARDSATTLRLRTLLGQITSLTKSGGLHWERQLGSAHRYARWNNHLLILGPDVPATDKKIPRSLIITPFDSPAYVEICSNDTDLGEGVLALAQEIESATAHEPPTDPFAVTNELLDNLT